MPVVPKQSKRKMNPSGKRECKKGRCLVSDSEVKPDVPISFTEETVAVPETEPELVFPDELPSQPDFQPIENEPQHLPIDESCCPSFDSIILETVKEEVEEVSVRVLSECKTKVWNAVTKRWLKLDGKKARQLGL